MLPPKFYNECNTKATINRASLLLKYQLRISMEKGVLEQANCYKSKY